MAPSLLSGFALAVGGNLREKPEVRTARRKWNSQACGRLTSSTSELWKDWRDKLDEEMQGICLQLFEIELEFILNENQASVGETFNEIIY